MTTVAALSAITASLPWRRQLGAIAAVPPRGLAYECAKRVLDVVLASALLVLFAPLVLLVAAAVKMTSRGPVIFKQTRAGLNGHPFMMYKFRTMHTGAEEVRPAIVHLNEKDGPVFKIARDPRLTPIGRLLRRSSIDELPQLINVLRGEMSLVGPRPLWMPEAQRTVGQARIRMAVKPGLTCLWQVSGRSELSYREWVKLDLHYVRNRGMLLDLAIMLQTIPAVISARGAY
jgi:lipopolysaccharide/colanic/teichoic acid biosynthesis glycosyltransferase